jgi:Ulp1 family protease
LEDELSQNETDDDYHIDKTILNKESVKDCVEIFLSSELHGVETFIYDNIVTKASFAVENSNKINKNEKIVHENNIKSTINFVGNIDINLLKLACLNTDTWLNDEILNSHLHMLSKFLESENYIILNTFFAAKVIDYKNTSGKTPKYHEETIKKWLKRHYKKERGSNESTSDPINLKDYFKDLEIIIFIRNIEQVIYFI